ncbi:MAG: transposase [Chloroflexota bacterium]|nr:transposase [Chloroflexota bacterium]
MPCHADHFDLTDTLTNTDGASCGLGANTAVRGEPAVHDRREIVDAILAVP